MRATKRLASTAIVIAGLPLTCASAPKPIGEGSLTAITALQAKTDQAKPRDRCFLYAQLASQLTDLASKQLQAGKSGEALESLRLVRWYADKSLLGATDDSRKLKDAEVLMRHTSFRLEDVLHQASYDDRHDLEETLRELRKVETQLMIDVFRK